MLELSVLITISPLTKALESSIPALMLVPVISVLALITGPADEGTVPVEERGRERVRESVCQRGKETVREREREKERGRETERAKV